MKPTEFKEQNTIIAKNQPPYLPLPARYDKGVLTSCWQGTWRERIQFLLAGRMFLTQLTFAQAVQPVRLHLDLDL